MAGPAEVFEIFLERSWRIGPGGAESVRTGGSTNPGNGAPLCGRHNRTKEQGYRNVRDQLGDLHVYRPDGSEIT